VEEILKNYGDIAGMKYLVLDSRIIGKTDNAKLVVTAAKKDPRNPFFGEDNPWEKRYDNLYANVLYDEQEKLFKSWYSPFIVDQSSLGIKIGERQKKKYQPQKGREMGVCYATSRDGFAWDKPDLGLVEFEGHKKNNIVYRGPHGAGVIKDLREKDAAKRYKMFTSWGQIKMGVSFSPDGIHWSSLSLCPDINPYRVDGTHYNTLWMEALGEWVGFTRMRDKRERGSDAMKKRLCAWPPRQVGRTTSKDYIHWTEAVPVMEGLEENLQIYSMPVFRHGSVFLGLPVIHNQRSDRAWTELAWSADTVEWHRVCPGSPLIANSDPIGSYDWGCAYSSAYPVYLENEIRLYYGSSNGLHFGWRDGFFCLATIRPDGFAGYEQKSDKKPATVTTATVECTGTELQLSADIETVGSVKVMLLDQSNEQLLAESEPIEQNVTDGVVKWKNGFSMERVQSRAVHLKFIINAAKLFSFSFELKQ
jgi:hypothetical protein